MLSPVSKTRGRAVILSKLRIWTSTVAMAAGLAAAMPVAPALAESLSGAYLASRQARYGSDFAAAAQYLSMALARDPSHPLLLDSAIQAFVSVGKIALALPIARKAEADGVGSQAGRMILAANEAKTGQFEALIARAESEKGSGPLVDGLMIAWAQVGLGDMSAALKAFDAVGKERGLASFAQYHKALALASVGDFEAAEKIFVADGAGALQGTRRGMVARLQIMSQVEKTTEAVALMDQVFGSDLDPELRDMRGDLEAGKPLPFSLARGAADGTAEVFYSIAGALSDEANPDYTLLYTRAALYLRPGHTDAALLAAGLLEDLEQHELAVEVYRSVPQDDPAFHAAELGRAAALRAAGKDEAAMEVLEQLARTSPDLPAVHVTIGDYLRAKDDFKGAVAAYDRALALYGDSQPSLWFLFYARGIAHEQMKDWQASEADFRKALELNPNQPQVLNYLGYSLVERGESLDEALDMIERAVASRPDSGYIVDSLGWVLFRLGRYDEAVGHMERAAELVAVDPIINDHLGDVYWSVGRKLEAEFQWQRALSFEPEEKDAARIRRKLEVGLDAVLAEEGAAPLKVANDDN